jgi:hypothetical protein
MTWSSKVGAAFMDGRLSTNVVSVSVFSFSSALVVVAQLLPWALTMAGI